MARLLIRPGGLGDTLLLAPALAALRAAGERSIHAVGYLERLEPLRVAGLVSRTWPLDRWMGSPEGILALLAEEAPSEISKRLSVDSFFDHLPTPPPMPYECRVHAPAPEPGSGIHAAAHLAAALGMPLPNPRTAPLETLACHQETRAEEKVWIHPGSGGGSKRWPLESFLELGEALRREKIEGCFLVGEAETDLAREIEGRGFRVHRPETPSALTRCLGLEDLFVGNDSGPGHLAALMGLRTVTIFGTTDPALWAPWGPHTRALTPNRGETWPPVERVAAELMGMRERAGDA